MCVFSETGSCFGELALINADSKRNATIVADEDCMFLVIRRQLYNHTLKVCSSLLSFLDCKKSPYNLSMQS